MDPFQAYRNCNNHRMWLCRCHRPLPLDKLGALPTQVIAMHRNEMKQKVLTYHFDPSDNGYDEERRQHANQDHPWQEQKICSLLAEK